MRYRHVKSRASNLKSPMVGRSVRSRLFAKMGAKRPFEQDLGELEQPRAKADTMLGRVGSKLIKMGENRVSPQVEFEDLPDVNPPIQDCFTPPSAPIDSRRGGADSILLPIVTPRLLFTVTGSTTSYALNVTDPTAANCAQVLAALLRALQVRGIVKVSEV